MARRLVPLVLIALAVLAPGLDAQETGRVEVVEVKGIIDASVERAVLATLEQAERQRAALVVLQIDSQGIVDVSRGERIMRALEASRVPVATWVGPLGARANNGAAALALAGHVAARSPGATIATGGVLDLRDPEATFEALSLEEVIEAASIADLLEEIDGTEIFVGTGQVTLATDADGVTVRFHKLDLFGRMLHAAAQPSIVYLLLLLALVGIVFELFHPSTGPAGVSGLAAMALAVYGIVTLGGSWIGFALIVAGVTAFCVDLRYSSLGPFTAGGLAALIAGSLLLFGSPFLRISPWVLAFGIVSMFLFLVAAMTRVLRDLRAVARGELEVRDAHPHPEGGSHDA